MTEVRPLRAYRYSSTKVGDLGLVVAPPYDVVSVEEREELYTRSPHNVVRLEAPLEQSGDNSGSNRFTRAALTLASWVQQGVLVQDSEPTFYLARHGFVHEGQSYSRRSLFGAVGLEPWEKGVIRPHEHTHEEPKRERSELLEACQTNISPIMALYDEPQGQIATLLDQQEHQPPLARLTTPEAGEHLLWAIKSRDSIAFLMQAFASLPLYIADGHHRYETALWYREKLRSSRKGTGGRAPEDFTLAALVPFSDPGLLALPIHRLLRGLSLESLGRRCTTLGLERGAIAPPSSLDSLLRLIKGLDGNSFALYSMERFEVLSIPRSLDRGAFFPGHLSSAWRDLTVAYLHTALLHPVLGMDDSQAEKEGHLAYAESAAEAINQVQTGEYQIALFLPPVSLSLLRQVADGGERMPPKSTYFYPKLATGLLMYRLEEGAVGGE